MDKIRKYVKAKLSLEPTGHDFYHAERVAQMAQKIYVLENKIVDQSSLKIIIASSYLHDTIDAKITAEIEETKAEITALLQDDYTSAEIKAIFAIIEKMSYSKNLAKKQKLTIEGQIVQDADRLDALGAIGIARAFAFGGKNNNLIYDPDMPPRLKLTEKDYKSKNSTTVNHFYEKLFKLEDLMNTQTGQKIAHERTKYMKKFLDEFLTEWYLYKEDD